MGDYKFLTSPMVLGDSDIDLILGMDWLSKHKDLLAKAEAYRTSEENS